MAALLSGRRLQGRLAMAADLPAPPLAGLVLAAGGASRFGGPKQLALVAGLPLVGRAVALALGCCDAGVVVVTGGHAAAVERALAGQPVRLQHNAAWAEGLAGSLRLGLEALPAAAGACLVLLCDQPGIEAADLARLVAAWRAAPERMAAAHYGGAPGVPAIFPRHSWPALMRLQGDRGASGLLAAAATLTTVPMPSAASDIDTRADLERWSGR